MKITKQKDHYLFENKQGSYHLSIEDYKKLGKEKAKQLAQEEIEKKLKGNQYSQATIDFSRARELGFCEYGIRDFAERLNLDVEKEYSIKELSEKLTPEVFLEYSYECRKLFGKNVLDLFGGVKNFLGDNKTEGALRYVLRHGGLPDNVLHTISCDFAERVLVNFEEKYPNDKRPRLAIVAKRKWINGEINDDELEKARSAAWSAAESAAYSAAWSAAESAAWSAAYSAETEHQINIVLKCL